MQPANTDHPNLYGMSRDELVAALGELDSARYRAAQVFRSLYWRDALDPRRWTDLPAAMRSRIGERFDVRRPTVVSHRTARDGATKFLLDLPGGGQVESVSIPAEGRMTFCISSQVGCAFGCTFCMTARLGFVRHLSCGEIVGQVAALLHETGTLPSSYNIVFMGMGEPLHNIDSVLAALRLLVDHQGFGLGPRRITVSTVGLINGISRLAREPIVPRLAISLVSADQQLRERLMPVARSVSLDALADAVRRFGEDRRDSPTFEVVMLRDVNDRPEHADQLVDLARRARAKVNLIEFNPTPELPFAPSPEARVQHFLRVLRDAGVVGTVRRSRGGDVDAACGQLAFSRFVTPSP